MHPSDSSSKISGTRRKMLGWGFAGVITSIASYLGWRQSQEVIRANASRKFTAAPASPPRGEKLPPASTPTAMSREAFVPHLESEFRIETGLLAVTSCKLVDVSAAQTLHSKTAKFTAFSLLFATREKLQAESKVYRVVHEQLGAMDLFLSPVGNDKERVLLEACFTQRA